MEQSVVSGDDGYPSEFTTLSDNDDQIAHHIGLNNEGQIKENMGVLIGNMLRLLMGVRLCTELS